MKNRKVTFILLILIFSAFAGFLSCKSSKKMTQVSKTSTATGAKQETKVTGETKEESKNPKESDKVNVSVNAKLEDYFNTIASSPSVAQANSKINEVLSLFANKDVPVLIAFFKDNGTKDYDEPTTIEKYLNYLKDQRKNTNKVDNVVYDEKGKIVELDLLYR